MKKSSYYFQHDYNASNDAKILFLRQQLGMEGYGIYWFILEQLVQAGGYLPLKIIPVLAMQCQTQEVKVEAVVKGFDLFEIQEDTFFSCRLIEHLEIRKDIAQKNSEKGKISADKRAQKQLQLNNSSTTVQPQFNYGSTTVEQRVQQRKGKERKRKDILYTDFDKSAYHQDLIDSYDAFNKFIDSSCPTLRKLEQQITIDQFKGIYEACMKDDTFLPNVKQKLLAMENKKGIERSYKSVYLTLKNWMR